MSQGFWPEGYYATDGLVDVEFTEVNSKDCCKLTFQMSGSTDKKGVLMFFTGGAAKISYETLEKLGWNGDTDNPVCAKPNAIDQLKCEHYTNPVTGKTSESWKTALAGKPLANDRKARLAAGYRAAIGKPAPTGRPAPLTPSTAPAPAPAAPAPAPPAPPAPPPQSDETKPYTKDGAWDDWCKFAAPKQPDPQKWHATVAAVEKASGKSETQFGPGEWGDVALAGEIPF